MQVLLEPHFDELERQVPRLPNALRRGELSVQANGRPLTTEEEARARARTRARQEATGHHGPQAPNERAGDAAQPRLPDERTGGHRQGRDSEKVRVLWSVRQDPQDCGEQAQTVQYQSSTGAKRLLLHHLQSKVRRSLGHQGRKRILP